MHVSRHETHALDRSLAGNLSAISRKWIRSRSRRRLLSALDTRTPTPPHRQTSISWSWCCFAVPLRGPRSQTQSAHCNRDPGRDQGRLPPLARSLAMTKTVKWFSLPKSSLPQNYMEGI